MNFKKGKPHLKNTRKEVQWGSPKKYQKGGESFLDTESEKFRKAYYKHIGKPEPVVKV